MKYACNTALFIFYNMIIILLLLQCYASSRFKRNFYHLDPKL